MPTIQLVVADSSIEQLLQGVPCSRIELFAEPTHGADAYGLVVTQSTPPDSERPGARAAHAQTAGARATGGQPRHKPGDIVAIAPAGAVLLDSLGAVPVQAQPDDVVAILMDLGGRLNKTTQDTETRYVMAPGHVGELVGELVVAVAAAGTEAKVAFDEQLQRQLARLGQPGSATA